MDVRTWKYCIRVANHNQIWTSLCILTGMTSSELVEACRTPKHDERVVTDRCKFRQIHYVEDRNLGSESNPFTLRINPGETLDLTLPGI